jgi:hypothetical protein
MSAKRITEPGAYPVTGLTLKKNLFSNKAIFVSPVDG